MYKQKAFEILSSSINSAVFIDEKAKDFFSNTPVDTEIVEEKLSVDLFNTFKNNGKSLTVHKFEKANIENKEVLNYLFNGKDLILLDWELDDVTGQEYSLQLLSRSIELPYINFCCIYSRSTNFNEIPNFLTAYFSGLNKVEFITIAENYGHLTIEEIQKFHSNSNNEIDSFFNENSINIEEFPIERLKNKSKQDILTLIYIALKNEKYIIPENKLNYEVIHSNDGSFIINNTFVLVLKKEENTDTEYETLIRRISNEIVKNRSSFFQLLGLEMQTIFNTNERFIDETILKSSTEALFSFRNHLNNDKTFGIIIKKLLLEQSTLKLRTAKLKLLDSEFLSSYSETLKDNEIKSDDLLQLNTFYNSVTVKGLNPEDIPNLNFGDVFKDDTNNYYLCITALCDCYYPNKIDHNFYFVTGKEFEDSELALVLGDTAFISFLTNGKAVYWGNLDDPKIKKIKEPSLSNSEDDSKKLKNDIDTLKQTIQNLLSNQGKLSNFLYVPFYIKPKVYNVENYKLINNKMRIWDITNKQAGENLNQNLNYFEVEYVTTLRNDYAQRIANHAFGHPARVGVDFVKK